jgi:hypothetical protein
VELMDFKSEDRERESSDLAVYLVGEKSVEVWS